MSGGTEHDFGSVCAAAGRMRREILGTQIRFGLNDSTDAFLDAVVVD